MCIDSGQWSSIYNFGWLAFQYAKAAVSRSPLLVGRFGEFPRTVVVAALGVIDHKRFTGANRYRREGLAGVPEDQKASIMPQVGDANAGCVLASQG